MVSPALFAAASLLALSSAAPVPAALSSPILDAEPACAGMLPAPATSGLARSPGLKDLLALRDIGIGHVGDLGHAMAVSPDGRQIALVLTRGNPTTNSYCQILVAVAADGKGQPRVLDTVGQPNLTRTTIRGIYNSSGLPAQNVPLWSPDGARLAYQKRAGTGGEAWEVDLATGKSERVSPVDLDVERIAWLDEGRSLAFAYRTGRKEAEAALRTEGRSGYLFDERFATYTGNRPWLRADLPLDFRAVDIESHEIREIGQAERALVVEPRSNDPAVLASATNRSGRGAWTALDRPQEWLSPVRIWSTDEAGNPLSCNEDACVANAVNRVILSLWWSRDGQSIYWLRRTGWSGEDVGLYRWIPGKRVVKVLQTSDLLIDCQLAESGLYCLQESSISPRKVVRVDEENGRIQQVYDPNPEWHSLRLGKVERLHWRNDNGFEVFGDLVLPPGYRAGTRLPLIVTQYSSRGFLRGATGDEVPIFPFASRGYAVLSTNMPQPYSMGQPDGHWASYREADRATNKDWDNRRSTLSAVMNGIDAVIAKGVAAPGSIGITGLSDGSTTAQFAIIANPDRFAAASVAACCLEPYNMMVFGGTALADERRAWGFPGVHGQDLVKWKPVSPSLNGQSIKTPLLISNGDNEFISGLETFTALRDADKAVEMYIYPDDYHIKIQPAHREAAYRRNLAWFDFWIRHREDFCVASEGEYDRWRKMTGAPAAAQLSRSESCLPGS